MAGCLSASLSEVSNYDRRKMSLKRIILKVYKVNFIISQDKKKLISPIFNESR